MREKLRAAVLLMLLAFCLTSCAKTDDNAKGSNVIQNATPHTDDSTKDTESAYESEPVEDNRSDIEKLMNGKYDFSSTAVDMTADSQSSQENSLIAADTEQGAQSELPFGDNSGPDAASKGSAGDNGTSLQEPEAATGEAATESDSGNSETEQEPEVEGTVVVDNERITFIINNIEAHPERAELEIGYYVSNRTAAELYFCIDNLAVNNYELSRCERARVQAEAYYFGSFSVEGIDYAGMGTEAVEKLELTLVTGVEASDEAERYELCVYPGGLTKDTLSSPEPVFRNGEKVCLGNEICSFIILETGTGEKGFYMDLFMENCSENSLEFSWSNTAINSVLFDLGWTETVRPGYRALERIYIDISDFEYFGVSSVEKVQFALCVKRLTTASEDTDISDGETTEAASEQDDTVFIDLFVFKV